MKILVTLIVIIIPHQLTQAHRFNYNWWSPVRQPKPSKAQKAYNQNDNLSSESLDVSKWLPMIPERDETESHHPEPEFELPQNENYLENEDNGLSDIQSSYLGIDWNQHEPAYRPSNGHQSYDERKFEKKHTFGYDHSISHHSEVHWDDKEEYPRPNLGPASRPTLQPTLQPTIRTTLRPLLRSNLRTTLPPTLRPTGRTTLSPAARTTTRTATRSITHTTLRPTTIISSTFRPTTTSSTNTLQPITTTYRPPLPTRFEMTLLPNVTTTLRPVRGKKVKNWLDMSTVIKPTGYRQDLTTTLSPLSYNTEWVTERTTERVTSKPIVDNKKRRKKVVKNLETVEPVTTEWTSDGLIDDDTESSTVAMDTEKGVFNNNDQKEGNQLLLLKKRRRKKPREYNKVSLEIDSSTLQPTQGFNLEQLEPLEGGQDLNKKWQGLQEDEVKPVTGSPLIQKKKGLLREDEIVDELKTILANRAKIEPLRDNLEPIHQENLDLDNIDDDNEDNLLTADPKMKLKKRQSLLEKEVKEETELESARLEDSIPGTPGRDYSIYYEIPKTTFRCSEQPFPGYYGDVQFKCQVFHLCQEDGRQDTFICPVGTLFNQATFVCDWWFNVNCHDSSQFYGLNEHIYEPTRISSERSSGLIAKREYLLENEENDRVDLKPEPIESKNQQVYFDEEIQNTKPVYVKTKLANL